MLGSEAAERLGSGCWRDWGWLWVARCLFRANRKRPADPWEEMVRGGSRVYCGREKEQSG